MVDHVAANDEQALLLLRQIVGTLDPARKANIALQPPRPPKFDAAELYGIIPRDVRAPYDVHEVIARIVDGSEFHEFKSLYGASLVCGFAHIWGMPVAILANNGVLFSESALKGAHFIELACQRRTPLLFLQNVSGFMVGGKYEAGGIAKDGAKLVTAVATASRAQVHRDHRRQLRRRQLRHVRARLFAPFPFSWPNSRISVMGGEQAASRAGDRSSRALEATRRNLDAGRGRFKAPIREKYEEEGNPYYATARLWDDGVIDPAQTRDVLGLALMTTLERADPGRGALRLVPDVASMIESLLDRQPRRDRPPHHPHRPAPGHSHHRGLFRRRRACACSCARPIRQFASARAAPRESYLDGARILAAATQTGAKAIHPGYGFLSENAEFARSVRKSRSGLGGRAAGGDPRHGPEGPGQEIMAEAGVPVTPGYLGEDQIAANIWPREAAKIGYPVLIKAVAGGGGKGMRRVGPGRRFRCRAGILQARSRRRVRRRPGADREICRSASPYRSAGLWRPSWQCSASVRARLLDAAPPPESDRGSARAWHG